MGTSQPTTPHAWQTDGATDDGSHECTGGGQVVNEFNAYRDILLGNDKRPHIADWMGQTGGL